MYAGEKAEPESVHSSGFSACMLNLRICSDCPLYEANTEGIGIAGASIRTSLHSQQVPQGSRYLCRKVMVSHYSITSSFRLGPNFSIMP